MSDSMREPAPGHPEGAATPGSPRERVPVFATASTAFGRLVFGCVTRVRVEGLSDIPKSGPLIIASNHTSNADALLIASYFLPVLDRPVHWLAKQEALDWPVLGWFIEANGAFGIQRGGADLEAFRVARQVLDEGRVLGLFPEGTRSSDGRLQEAKDGATLLALRTQAPILPVGIAGAHRFWPKGQLVFRPGGYIAIHVGRPFRLEPAPRGQDRHRALGEATRVLMGRIAELLPPDQRGAYGAGG